MRTAEVLTPDCGSGRHGRCTHRNPSEKGFPKRLRDGFTIALCGCDCHAACPLTGHADVSDREWEESCSCPGAQLPRDFYRARREGDQRLRAAAAAVQAESAGKTRTEIRQLLISELKADPGRCRGATTSISQSITLRDPPSRKRRGERAHRAR